MAEEAGHGYATTQLLLLIEKCPRITIIFGNGEKCLLQLGRSWGNYLYCLITSIGAVYASNGSRYYVHAMSVYNVYM